MERVETELIYRKEDIDELQKKQVIMEEQQTKIQREMELRTRILNEDMKIIAEILTNPQVDTNTKSIVKETLDRGLPTTDEEELDRMSNDAEYQQFLVILKKYRNGGVTNGR